mgnify:CR=1 FL=1
MRQIAPQTIAKSLLFLLIVVAVQSCTTKRDGRIYRWHHNTNARFNGFFFAKEALVEADEKIESLYEPNWDEILPLYLDTDEKSAQQVYPLMERAIEKCSRVVDRHTINPSKRDRKYFKRPELNKWIDDNYMVIGKAYYMKEDYAKSEEIFLYLARTVDTYDAQAWAYSWLGRIYIKTEEFVKAKNMLAKAENYRDTEEEVGIHTGFVMTQYHITQENFEAAARELEATIELIKKKKDKARPLFVLAQLQREMGDSESAIETFSIVADMRVPYELEFQANIQQAMTYERKGGSSESIFELLEKMLDDDKNTEYLDQIYYALADVALEDRMRNEGIYYLERAVYTSQGNSRILGKSYLRLADLHMEDLHYEVAQAYYDSALVHMPADNERKDEVEDLASNLTDLVGNLRTIEEQDSLLELCGMDEIARERLIERIWEDMADELDRQREEHEAAQAAALAEAGNIGEGMFWPYNASLRIGGMQNFQDFWGDRPLEDHWRRINKISDVFAEDEDTGEDDEEQEGLDPFDIANLPTVEEMLEDLPCEEDEYAEALGILAEAYYNAGLDYREKLSDPEEAINIWQELLDRMDSSAFHPTATYQLFRTYLQREIEEEYENPYCETCNSEYWAQQVVDLYPGSEWALLIENPDFKDEEEEAYEFERLAYEGFLSRFYAKDYQNTLLDIDSVLIERPNNPLLCKYQLLRTQCVGGLTSYTGDRDPYFQALNDITINCPETEESEFASALLQQLGVSLGGAPKEDVEDKKPPSAFVVNDEKDHYFAVLVPVETNKSEQVKAKSSDFNKEFFNTQRLRVTSNLLNRTHQIVLIKSFSGKAKAMDYYTVYTGNREMLIDVNSGGFNMFIISSSNYIELFKNKDIEGYTDFFTEHYLSEKSKQDP